MSTMTSGSAFRRKRAVRIGAGVATAGVMAGFSLVAAAPASAVTDAECASLPTVDAGAADPTGDIQTLLDNPLIGVICLSGTIVIDNTLYYDRTVTLHGLPGATLDGDETYTILEQYGDDNPFTNPVLLTIESLHLTNGDASDDDGGAIDAYSFVEVYDSVFDFNDADDDGGAISAYGVNVNNSVFGTNTSGRFGGAIYGENFVTSTNSTFEHNDAEGGGAITSYGVAEIYSSTFFDNTADFVGGAVYVPGGGVTDSLYVENSTFVQNGAGFAGAIGSTGGTVLQSTFLDNDSSDDGGQSIGIFNFGNSDPSTLLVRGNLFTSTSATTPELTDDTELVEFVDGGGNLFSTTVATENLGFVATEPSTKFGYTPASLYATGALGDNGGPTQTVALSDSSPAIDAVPAGEPSVDVDERGEARTTLSDAGAYEHGALALAATGAPLNGWLGGAAALLLAAGGAVLIATRRTLRLR